MTFLVSVIFQLEKMTALICDKCEKWVHAKCTKMSDIRYEHHEINLEDIFECRKCRTCGICDKVIALNHKFIECNSCMNYVHIKGNNLMQSNTKGT